MFKYPCPGTGPMPSLTALTHNIFWGLGAPASYRGQALRVMRYVRPTAQQKLVPHIIEALAWLRPDLVGLQEVDGGSRRNGRVSQADKIARALGYSVSFGPEKTRFGLHEGNALLTSLPVEGSSVVKLPAYTEPRNAVVAKVRAGDAQIRVVVTHLAMPFLVMDQRQQIRALASLLGPARQPMIVMGDFNCEPKSRAFRAFLRATRLRPVSILPSYPAFAVRWAYDNILVSPHFDVIEAQVVPLWVSDHLPVMARLALKPEALAVATVPEPARA